MSLIAICLCFPGLALPCANGKESPQLELRVSLDRPEYIHREPIFIDVTILNKGKETVKVAPPKESTHLWLDCKDKGGKRFKVVGGWVYHLPPLKYWLDIEPGKSTRMWFDPRNHYHGLGTTGEFTSELVWEASIYDPKLVGKRQETQIRSKSFTLKVSPPTGDDIKPVQLIEDELPLWWLERDSEVFGLQGPIFYTDTKRELNSAILATKSDRFKAAVYYYRGTKDIAWAENRGNDSEFLQLAIQNLTLCKQSKGSSRYLKGLCDYQLIVCKEIELAGETKNRAKRIAELAERVKRLQADHPNTAFADKAQALLKKHDHPEK